MPHILPISDFRDNIANISKAVHESSEPIFLTKDGYGDMVLMSMKSYEEKRFESEIYLKLKEAEFEAKATDKRLTHEEVFSGLRGRVVARTQANV